MNKKIIFSIIATLGLSAPAFAAPVIDFSTLSGGSPLTFNNLETDTATLGGVTIDGFVYTGGTTYVTDQGFIWLRNNSNDHGLGYCSEGTDCGPKASTGLGDFNELSNNNKFEVIRLTLPTGKAWSDIFVSSLDTGGSNNNETGTLYWSNTANQNLSMLSGFTFSHTSNTSLGGSNEGSILLPAGFDVNAKYLFFRAGPNTDSINPNNNDYLVWGVSVTAVPEPEIYAMMGIGLALMGFVARRRQGQAAAA